MDRKKSLSLSIIGALTIWLVGCGGGGSNSGSTQTATTGTGYYVDSAVAGVDYTCGSQSGKTGSDGNFTFEKGKECTFSVAGIKLRVVPADNLADNAKIVENNVKVARFLQSIDTDGNPTNGIQISDKTIKAVESALKQNNITSVPQDDNLIVVVEEVKQLDDTFKGGVKTEQEVEQHLQKTETDVTKERLAGKTFYVVGQNVNNHSDIWGGKVVFNPSLTSINYTEAYGQDAGTVANQAIQLIKGNKIIWQPDNSYTIVGMNKGNYIEFPDYNADGSLYSHTRIYFDKSKADAYAASFGSSGSTTGDLASYIVGKTYYMPVKDSYYDDNGTLINNDHVETLMYKADGHTVIDTWIEGGKTYSKQFSYSINGNSITISGTNSEGNKFNKTLSNLIDHGKYIDFSDVSEGKDVKLYKSKADAEATLGGGS